MARPDDNTTTLADLRRIMARFVAARRWQKFHKPKNLAMSLAVEAAELMEHFQWLTHAQAAKTLAGGPARRQVADEMSDVLAFLLSLANAAGIDLARSFADKMRRNELKYPAHKVRGTYRKPRR